MSSGVVLDDVKGGKLDLAVGKGDLVDIMRMDNNPTGKFLVKSEDNRCKSRFLSVLRNEM